MPCYIHACELGHRNTVFRRIEDRHRPIACEICGGQTELRITPTMVSVFEPYTTVAFDKERGEPMVIRSKSEHESFLTRNGYEEIGTDKSMAPLSQEEIAHRRQEQVRDRGDVVFDLNEETHEAVL